MKYKGVTPESLGLVYRTQEQPMMANHRYQREEIPGRDGAIYFDMGLDDIKIKLEFLLEGSDRVAKRAVIANWLTAPGVLELNGQTYQIRAISYTAGEYRENFETFGVEFVGSLQ